MYDFIIVLQNAIYEFYLEDSSTFLLCAQRRKSKTPNFLISMDRDELDKKSNNCIAKLTTNFSGTQCMLYDRGRDPEAVYVHMPCIIDGMQALLSWCGVRNCGMILMMDS